MKALLLALGAVSLSAQGLQFYPIPPCRLVDTRGASAGFVGVAPFSGPSIPSGGTATFPALAANQTTAPTPCAIPSTAQAYALNLTVVPPRPLAGVDYVTLWPSGQPQPTTSSINDALGAILGNGAIIAAGVPAGGISVYNSGPSNTDVVIDVSGYFAPAPSSGSVTGGAILPSFPITITPGLITMGGGAGQSAANGVSTMPGPFALTSSQVTTDTGEVQIGFTAANQVACYIINMPMIDTKGVIHFGATGFAGGTCLPGPDANPGDWMTLIPVTAGQFQSTGPQYAPVVALAPAPW